MTRFQLWTTSATLFALLALTLLIYWPGLNGPLLIDDIPNLNRLKSIGPIDDQATFLQFVFSKSGAYPVRPLSYASFLLNDIDWPLYVPMHKYTNVLIHLINGALVFWVSLLLCRIIRVSSGQLMLITVFSTGLWLLAPLQVSTVLYVVQRMTELSALFVLCGFITYCYGRQRLDERPTAALIQMTCGLAVFGVLGFLSKQNAILLTLYILVAEYTLFKTYLPVGDPKTRSYFTAWKWVFLVAPMLLTFSVIALQGVFEGYQYRPFTFLERVLTQARILFDYLHSLLVPARFGLGLTHDDFEVSTGLFSPPTTILAVAGILALLGVAFVVSRKAVSPFAFGVLWFFSGHLLESTIIPLELYWEHRNYLPAFGPLFAITFYVWTLRLTLSRFLKGAFVLYAFAFVIVTKQNVDVWSDKWVLAELWAEEHPKSVRAQQVYADYWTRLGYYGKADEIVRQAAERRPDSMGAQVQVLLTTCRHEPDRVPETFEELIPRIRIAYFDNSVAPTIKILSELNNKICPELTNDRLLELIDEILRNDSIDRRAPVVASLLLLKASILSETTSAQAVVSHLYVAFQRSPNYHLGLVAVDYLYKIKEYQLALDVLNQTADIPLDLFSPENFRTDEIEAWRKRIREKL